MQKIATRIFICASIAFGIIGIAFVLSLGPGPDSMMSDLTRILQKLMFISVLIILPSFALSIAGKYLSDKRTGTEI